MDSPTGLAGRDVSRVGHGSVSCWPTTVREEAVAATPSGKALAIRSAGLGTNWCVKDRRTPVNKMSSSRARELIVAEPNYECIVPVLTFQNQVVLEKQRSS